MGYICLQSLRNYFSFLLVTFASPLILVKTPLQLTAIPFVSRVLWKSEAVPGSQKAAVGWVMVAGANYQVIVPNGANPNFISQLIVHPSRLDGFYHPGVTLRCNQCCHNTGSSGPP